MRVPLYYWLGYWPPDSVAIIVEAENGAMIIYTEDGYVIMQTDKGCYQILGCQGEVSIIGDTQLSGDIIE